jgi:hypothetical protein
LKNFFWKFPFHLLKNNFAHFVLSEMSISQASQLVSCAETIDFTGVSADLYPKKRAGSALQSSTMNERNIVSLPALF